MIAAYYRVSTRGQGDDDKWGLPRQREAVYRWAAANAPELKPGQMPCPCVEMEYEDVGFSGVSADRPGLAELLADAKEGKFTTLVVAARDRLARDSMLMGWIAHQLRACGVTIVSASEPMGNGDDPTSRLVGEILAAVASFERHLITARLSAARRLKARAGGYAHGQAPYGTRPDGTGGLEVEPIELHILTTVNDWRNSGHSYHKIACHLTASLTPTRRGGRWTAATVRSVLRSRPRVEAMLASQNQNEHDMTRELNE